MLPQRKSLREFFGNQLCTVLHRGAFGATDGPANLLMQLMFHPSSGTENPWIRLNLAQRYLDLGEHDEAERVIRQVISRWPENEIVCTVTAITATLRDDDAAARKTAARLLVLDANNAYALAVMNVVDQQQGHHADALARCASAASVLFIPGAPWVDGSNWSLAVAVATVLQKTGDRAQADVLLDQVDIRLRATARLGVAGFGIADVQVRALRGRKREALAALRAAERAGWRGGLWPLRYYRDRDSSLDSIRNDPEFKIVFADIERDMTRQRAELAARPKDAPLHLGSPLT